MSNCYEYGQAGYDAYAQCTGGKTFDGRDMPLWSELPQRIQDAWNAAAEAIEERIASESISFEYLQ